MLECALGAGNGDFIEKANYIAVAYAEIVSDEGKVNLRSILRE